MELTKGFQVTTELWSHQKNAVAFSEGKDGCMLAMEMATGKSLTAIKIAHDRKCNRILIVCTVNAIDAEVWQEQLDDHTNGANVFLIEGTKKKKFDLLQEAMKHDQCFIIISYDSIWRSGIGNFIKMALFDGLIDMIIADEIHRIKSFDSKVSEYFSKLYALCPNRFGLTGTPFHNSPLDIFGQYRFLESEIYGWNYYKFKNRYAIVRQLPGSNIPFVVGFKNQDELKSKFNQIAFVVKSEEVQKYLPEQNFVKRLFKLKGGNKKGYERLLQEKEQMKKDGARKNERLKMFTREQQMTCGVDVEMNEVYDDKQKALEETLGDLDANEPVVILGRFHYDLDMIHRTAANLNRKCFEQSGRVKQLKEWHQNVSSGALLAGQIQTVRDSIDLCECRYPIFYSLPSSLGDFEQILKRFHRPKQKRGVTYIHLLAKGTIDEKMSEALRKKKNVANYLLEDDDD